MDTKAQISQKNRFMKLSLKKNKQKVNEKQKKLDRSSDIIVLDDSFSEIKSDFSKNVQKVCSPIVINDSCELSFEENLPKVVFSVKEKDPSKCGNVSFNCSQENVSPMHEPRPNIDSCWSPAQSIICATPKHEPIPSTPKDVANESSERCSIKKIQQSQKKLLSDLYGDTWKSIPKLFKTLSHQYSNFDGATKKLQFDDDESDKENIRHVVKRNKELYLTSSDIKSKKDNTIGDSEKKSKKKLYTEKVLSTPDLQKPKIRNVNSTTKKTKVNKAMTVTELVNVMNGDVKDVELIAKRIEKVTVTQDIPSLNGYKRLSFVGSLADNVPSWRCHPEAIQYHDNYKALKEQLARRLFTEFNKGIFDDALEVDMPIIWDTKLRSTAGTTTNRSIKTSRGERLRSSTIRLSTKVLDVPQRLRDTLVHELCHAATWLLDHDLRAGHGPLWKKWATRALRVYPELGEISRCHNMEIHFKYCYKCTKCGYSIKRHSKSIDITKKCCGHCRGTFEIILNKKNKDGVVVSTPARKANANDFAMYVKENYASVKDSTKTHAQVMKVLGEQFSARKNQLST